MGDRGALHTTGIPTHGDCQDNTGASAGATSRKPAPDACVPGKFENTKPGNFAIFIDDMKKPVLQIKISLRKDDTTNCHDEDLDRCVLDTQGNAYIGFTAATGGERPGVTMDQYGRSSTMRQTDVILGNSNGMGNAAIEAAELKTGAAQVHEILNWKFCNFIGCVPI